MTRVISVAALVFLAALTTEAQQRQVIINPGLRVGYTFGADGGFFYGFDLSVTTYLDSRPLALGAYLSVESRDTFHVTHLGVEAFYGAAGVAIGPAKISGSAVNGWGWSASVFGGVIILPFYQMTLAPGGYHFHEIGGFFKFPISTRKGQFHASV